MNALTLNGTPDEQELVGHIAGLFALRGFCFALDAPIEVDLDELTAYFLQQESGADEKDVRAKVEGALTTNAHIFQRVGSSEEGHVTYRVFKRQLAALMEAQSRTPAKPAPHAEQRPAAPEETPSLPRKATMAEAEPAGGTPAGRPIDALPDLSINGRYVLSTLLALHRLGGSALASDVIAGVPALMTLPDEHQGMYLRGSSGKEEPKYVKYVHWARRELLNEGLLESPRRGEWAITPAGEARLRELGLIE